MKSKLLFTVVVLVMALVAGAILVILDFWVATQQEKTIQEVPRDSTSGIFVDEAARNLPSEVIEAIEILQEHGVKDAKIEADNGRIYVHVRRFHVFRLDTLDAKPVLALDWRLTFQKIRTVE